MGDKSNRASSRSTSSERSAIKLEFENVISLLNKDSMTPLTLYCNNYSELIFLECKVGKKQRIAFIEFKRPYLVKVEKRLGIQKLYIKKMDTDKPCPLTERQVEYLDTLSKGISGMDVVSISSECICVYRTVKNEHEFYTIYDPKTEEVQDSSVSSSSERPETLEDSDTETVKLERKAAEIIRKVEPDFDIRKVEEDIEKGGDDKTEADAPADTQDVVYELKFVDNHGDEVDDVSLDINSLEVPDNFEFDNPSVNLVNENVIIGVFYPCIFFKEYYSHRETFETILTGVYSQLESNEANIINDYIEKIKEMQKTADDLLKKRLDDLREDYIKMKKTVDKFNVLYDKLDKHKGKDELKNDVAKYTNEIKSQINELNIEMLRIKDRINEVLVNRVYMLEAFIKDTE